VDKAVHLFDIYPGFEKDHAAAQAVQDGYEFLRRNQLLRCPLGLFHWNEIIKRPVDNESRRPVTPMERTKPGYVVARRPLLVGS
jgi:hypothetical protein